VTPEVSIVLPTRDRPGPLRAAVESLLAQEGAGRQQRIVVDDGRDHEARAYLAGLEREGRVELVQGGGQGPAAARNAGLAAARAPVVACTDDDCEVPRDWALSLHGRLRRSGAAAVGGRVRPGPAAPLAGRVAQAITSGFARSLNRDPADARFLTSNNVAYDAARLREAGGFDEGFRGAGGEERDLHARLRARGHRLLFAPEVVVWHNGCAGWGSLLRQQAGYGRGARLFYARDPARRRFTPGEYLRAFAAGLGELSPADGPAFVLGFLLAQSAVAWGYSRGSR